MKVEQVQAEAILEIAHACFSRGNLELFSEDPVTLDLYLVFTEMLAEWKNSRAA
jgi:hypothetical protein